MAVNSFEDVLNSLTDEADKTAFTELSGKYPTMKEGWLRQSDYSKKLDALRSTELEYKEYKGKAEEYENKFKEVSTQVDQWNSWVEANWDKEADIPKMEKFWKEKAEELESKIGTDMTFDDVGKFITDKGLVSKTDLDSVLTSKADEINKNFQGSAYFAAVIAEKQGDHITEFHKPLKVREFVSKFNEYGTNDIDAAYEKYVAEDRKVIADKALETKLDQVRKDERAKAEQEFAEKKFNQGLPVDQAEAGLGHLESKIRNLRDPDALEKATLGSGTIAQLAASEYRKEKLGIANA